MSVEVLLWDCDGVLQHNPHSWAEVLDELGGAGFAHRVFTAEVPALRGETSLRAALTAAVAEHEAETGLRPREVDELLAMWETTVLDPEAVAVLQAVRSLGVRCVLATNQQDHRVEHMRGAMGYDDLVDGAYWSSEMGVMKPDVEFFEAVLEDLGVPAERVGFVDDVQRNVDAALVVGIRAVRHDPTSGAAGLVRDLDPLVDGLAAELARQLGADTDAL